MAQMTVKRYTTGEEIANALSHGITAVAAVAGTAVMITLAACFGGGRAVFCAAVFGITLILMYTVSTLYHAIPFEKAKEILRTFDHASIPLLIAGSYTPFCLITLQNSAKGVFVAAVVWLCGITSVILNFVNLDKFEKINLIIYVIMGWTALAAIKDIAVNLTFTGFVLLLGGGLSYTVGIIFYKMTKSRYMHAVWHIFVSLGSILHFLCVVIYVLPTAY